MPPRKSRPLLRVVPRIVLRTTFAAVIPVCASMAPSVACVPNYCPPDGGCDDGTGTDAATEAGDAGEAGAVSGPSDAGPDR